MNWSMYKDHSKRLKEISASAFRGNLVLYFNGWKEGVKASKYEKEVKVRDAIGRMNHAIGKRVIYEWYIYKQKVTKIFVLF